MESVDRLCVFLFGVELEQLGCFDDCPTKMPDAFWRVLGAMAQVWKDALCLDFCAFLDVLPQEAVLMHIWKEIS